jgi:hypothetical protein
MKEKRDGARQRYRQDRADMAQRSIPELIDLLGSADLTARFLAEMCLRDATST